MNYNEYISNVIPEDEDEGVFKEFDATELYCPRCRQAVPVRKRLLLILPEGEKYEYRCAYCGESVGTKLNAKKQPLLFV
jgi:DNA-directed RNA polymerase subunit RPC12/RpoP